MLSWIIRKQWKIDSHVRYRPVDCSSVLICRRKLAVSSNERHSQDYRDARESWGVIQDQHDPRQPRHCCGTRIDISYRHTEQNPSPSDTPCWDPSRTIDTVNHQNVHHFLYALFSSVSREIFLIKLINSQSMSQYFILGKCPRMNFFSTC